LLACALLCAFVLASTAQSVSAQAPAQPTGFSALHRSGQTFLTFVENAALVGERYRVYRAHAPIDALTLADAQLVCELWEDSGAFSADRYFLPGQGIYKKRYLDRFVIEHGGPELPLGTGLLVWTLRAEDFLAGTAGPAWYAITSVSPSGEENASDFSAQNALGPVEESVAPPVPVRVGSAAAGIGTVYTQFMDLRAWNPTFDAPNAVNGWYGLDPQAPSVAHALQYAYTYVVIPPLGGCALQQDPRSVLVNLHGYGGYKYRPMQLDPDPGWCMAYRIYPVDIADTWHFGFAREHDYRASAQPPVGDEIENFTEQRVLMMVDALLRDPAHGPLIDAQRVYLWGFSMGGSGTLAMAMRYPGVFAAAYAGQPMTKYATAGDAGGTPWKPDFIERWGALEENLPIRSRAPNGWADHLTDFDGTGVWTWQDHGAQLATLQSREMVPLALDHGLLDTVIEWSTQGQPFYAPLAAARRTIAGAVTDTPHLWSQFAALPVPLALGAQATPFYGFTVRRDETTPGFSASTDSLALPPTGAGTLNKHLDWSSSWAPWDGAPIDTADHWRMSLRSRDGLVHRVDLSPRRTQQFAVAPGARFTYELRVLPDLTLKTAGVAQADAFGVLTLPNVRVTPKGVRALIWRVPEAGTLFGTPAQLSLASGGVQQLQIAAGPGMANRPYWLMGTLSGIQPGQGMDPFKLPLNADAYFAFTVENPNAAPLLGSQGTLDGSGNASASFVLPAGLPSTLAGLTLHHAYAVFDVQTGLAVYVSEPSALVFAP
jgi:hypothetical protein